MRSSMVAAALLAPPLACGSFLALNGDDGNDGGAPDAGAGVDLDASGAEGSTTGDGGPCIAKFCSSFDDGDTPPFNWSRFGPNGEPPTLFFGVNTAAWTSPPRSFRVQTSPAAGGEEQWLELVLPENPSPTSGWIQLNLRIDALPSAQEAETLRFLVLNWQSGGDAARVLLTHEGQLALSTGSGGGVSTSGPMFALGAWTTVRLEFSVTGTRVDTTLRRGGAASSAVFEECDGAPLKVRLGANAGSSSSPAAFDVSFDDVAVDW